MSQPAQSTDLKTVRSIQDSLQSPKTEKWEETPYMKELAIRRSKPVETPPPAPIVYQPQPLPKPVPVAPTGSCGEWIEAAGVDDVGSAVQLIQRESGCNPNAVNPTSGACGIPQELPCGKSGCGSDPVCQIRWMQSYVKARYGSWANALSFQLSRGWY